MPQYQVQATTYICHIDNISNETSFSFVIGFYAEEHNIVAARPLLGNDFETNNKKYSLQGSSFIISK
jgi:hypothetical protein